MFQASNPMPSLRGVVTSTRLAREIGISASQFRRRAAKLREAGRPIPGEIRTKGQHRYRVCPALLKWLKVQRQPKQDTHQPAPHESNVVHFTGSIDSKVEVKDLASFLANWLMESSRKVKERNVTRDECQRLRMDLYVLASVVSNILEEIERVEAEWQTQRGWRN